MKAALQNKNQETPFYTTEGTTFSHDVIISEAYALKSIGLPTNSVNIVVIFLLLFAWQVLAHNILSGNN